MYKTFEEKYKESFSDVLKTDFIQNGKKLGLSQTGDSLLFNLFNGIILFSERGIFYESGSDPGFAVKYLLSRYLLNYYPHEKNSSEKLITIREIAGAGPLFSDFTSNKGKIIETTFKGQTELLEERCFELSGKKLDNPSFDLSFLFHPFPLTPLYLNFNDEDEMMASSSTILFNEDITKYFDIEAISVIATFFTGLLIKKRGSDS